MNSVRTEEKTLNPLKKQGGSAFTAFNNSNGLSPQILDKVDVILIFLPKNEKEYIPNVPTKKTQSGDIILSHLTSHLKEMGFPLEKNVISYYSQGPDIYVYSGIDPLPISALIPASDIAKNGDNRQVTLRIRQGQGSTGGASAQNSVGEKAQIKVESVKQEIVLEQNSDDGAGGSGPLQRQKRTKERKIGEILEKVLQWRRLYNGTPDPKTGQMVKMSLEDAAQKVGISKKSLDDYLLQIRFGKKHGFSFNDHINDKVGVLRSFVKKHKTKKMTKAESGAEDEHFGNDFEYLPLKVIQMYRMNSQIYSKVEAMRNREV
jgi:hypothetical protein